MFIWCPMSRFKLELRCPQHDEPLKISRWMGNLKSEGSDNPRLVYDIGGNILLIQRHYSCSMNLEGSNGSGHRYMSGAVEIMQMLPTYARQSFPIEIHFKSAISRQLLDYLLIQVQQGTNFMKICQGIGSLNFREYIARHFNQPNREGSSEDIESAFYQNFLYSFPSNDKLMHLFLSYYDKTKELLEQDMRSHIGNILICDHTFKLGSHIGERSSRKEPSDGQFDRAFIGLNEHGEVMFLRLTREAGFEQVEDLLQDFKLRLVNEGIQLELILVEDCCISQDHLSHIFGDVPVKLSPFHATQRVLESLPPWFKDMKRFAKDFRLVFRAKDDRNDERFQNTPEGSVINDNLEHFMTRWSNKLPEETVERIHDLREHIERGCLSGIPPGEGTERNEKLHDFLTESLLCAAKSLSPELAIAILAYVLYVWNCQRKARKHNSNCRVVPTIPIETKQPFSSSDIYKMCLKADGKLNTELIWRKASELGIHQFIQVEFEAVTDVACLENENLVKYAITRALHLQEIFNLVAQKSDKKNLNVVEFPYYWVKGYSFLLRCVTTECEDILNNGAEKTINEDALERNLASFGLERNAVASDGNCCFTSIVSQLFKLKDSQAISKEYDDFLIDLGLYKSIEEDATTLRLLFTKEVSENLDVYKKWVNLSDCEAQYEIEQFSKPGWFSSDIGDLCVMVCSRIVQSPIVVITSYIHAPYLPFVPEKLSSSQPLFIAFDHTAPGHYDSTQELLLVKNTMLTKCCCGKSRRGEKSIGLSSCSESEAGHSKCSCLKLGQACNRMCRCRNCCNPLNEKERKFRPARKNRKACMCGNGRKESDGIFISCKDKDTRKSKCPCLRDSVGCTNDCRCRNCGNIYNSPDFIPGGKRGCEEELSTFKGKAKRRRSNPQSYKRIKGAVFASNQDGEVSSGVWSELETIMLVVIQEILFLTELPSETSNIISLYQFIAVSEFVTEMKLPIVKKENVEIEAKLVEMIAKQQLMLEGLNPRTLTVSDVAMSAVEN
ncbi:uncharacterized protein LOC124434843 isoform X2 [Xenia sp. Carnegie-2017]|nr:uncharacterized protein LOC124434843 isoform X2 [Xenia sp. Carnegie-2017]